jgi:hypothetical protein
MTEKEVQEIVGKFQAIANQNRSLEKALKSYLLKIDKRANEDKAAINDIIALLNGEKTTVTKKSPRKVRDKLSADEILNKIKDVLVGGELSANKICDKTGIANPKCAAILKDNPDIFGNKGSKKTSVWFLK